MTSASHLQPQGVPLPDEGRALALPRTCVGLIGFGAVGKEVAKCLKADGTPVQVVALSRRAMTDPNVEYWVGQTDDLIGARPKLVVEAASHGAVAEHVVPILKAGISVVVASVGALASDPLRSQVTEAAQAGMASLILPGGAIGALDYIRTVSQASDLRIRYCSRKPIAAWEDELIARGMFPDKITCEVTLFEGTARDAALFFPQNLNVAMTLALAGPGIEGVEVRVVADPKASGNTHEIEVESAAGRAALVFNNKPSPSNPKTSALTAMSIVYAAREHLCVLDARR